MRGKNAEAKKGENIFVYTKPAPQALSVIVASITCASPRHIAFSYDTPDGKYSLYTTSFLLLLLLFILVKFRTEIFNGCSSFVAGALFSIYLRHHQVLLFVFSFSFSPPFYAFQFDFITVVHKFFAARCWLFSFFFLCFHHFFLFHF